MSEISIVVNNLSKRYRIGLKEEIYDTFVSSAISWLKSPVSNYRRVHSLSSFSDNGEGDDVIWALKDVSFNVKRGEVLGIIGKNGAGKSTLLKILCRITEPTSGNAKVFGKIASLLEVGTGFHPELTGRDNVYLNGTILGMKRKEINKKFDEIVSFSGIEKFIETPVKRYSSGMRVRLAFAVAAHLDPEILLIDEVLAVGDSEFQEKCLGKMKEISEFEGRSVIYVSHNMASIQQLCDKCLILDKGNLLGINDPIDAIREYLGSGNRSALKVIDLVSDSLKIPHPLSERISVKVFEIIEESLMKPFDQLNFKILLKAEIEINDLIIGMNFFGSYGQRIGTSISNINKLKEGIHSINIQLKNHQLPPGNYTINLGIFKKGKAIYTKSQALMFEVFSEGCNETYINNRRDKLGVCFNTKISILQ